jgi:predicted MPP superfamily phosphohydrolase
VQKAVDRWLVVLNAGLVLVGIGLGLAGVRRGWFLPVLVLVAFVPMSYARSRLHASLARAIRSGRALVAWAATGVACDLVLVAQLLTARTPDTLSALHGTGIAWVGPVWFSAHVLWLLGWGVGRLLGGAVRLPGRVVARSRRATRATDAAAADDALASPARREFLQRMAVAGAAVPFAAATSGVPISYDFRVEEREIEVAGWPRELDGLRIVHLSDIHVGGGMNRERLQRVRELTNAARPDLVLHTGDFLTHRGGEFDTPLYEALARVRAPLGQFACLGNHDYDDPDGIVRRLGDAGVAVLRNRLTQVTVAGRPLEIGGTDFVFGARGRAARYAQVVGGWRPRDGTPRLLLNHDPIAFGSLPERAANLVLSGHTHGGHVGVQLGPSQAFTVIGLLGLPDQGLFARDDMRLFVTRCVGFYGYPMRVGIPPEIAVLVLRTPGAAARPSPVRPA